MIYGKRKRSYRKYRGRSKKYRSYRSYKPARTSSSRSVRSIVAARRRGFGRVTPTRPPKRSLATTPSPTTYSSWGNRANRASKRLRQAALSFVDRHGPAVANHVARMVLTRLTASRPRPVEIGWAPPPRIMG